MNLVQQLAAEGEIATGLLYVDPQAGDLHLHFPRVGYVALPGKT